MMHGSSLTAFLVGFEHTRPVLDALAQPVALLRAEPGRWILEYVNPAFTELTDLALAAGAGPDFTDCLVPDADSAARLELEQALAAGHPARIECTLRQGADGRFPAEVQISPLPAGPDESAWFLVSVKDLTAFRKIVKELTAERDRYLGFLETAPLGIMALDSVMNGIVIADARRPNQPIVFANAAFERLTGYSTEEVLGREIAFLPNLAPDRGAEQELAAALAEARECRVELLCRRKDGQAFWNELAIFPIFNGLGELTHFLGIHSDVTERRAIQTELEFITAELEKNRDHLLSILDQFPSATLIVDPQDWILFASASCGQTLKLEPDHLVGKRWSEALPVGATDVAAVRKASSLAGDRRAPIDLVFKSGAGGPRWLSCQIRDDPRDPGRRLFFFDDVSEVHRLREEILSGRHGRMVGDSEGMRRLLRLIEDIAQGDWTVLIEGETGTGKDLVARAIHDHSPRAAEPFIAVNSAGLSESLLMSQLFGHRRGAFTGATQDQMGYFEAANGGTLFLDEIGDLPLPMQASLLRVLQEREVTRLGDTRPRKVDVRVIAATHRNLGQEVKEGRFREDLLFRLRVARVTVPPLRERKTDIPLLAEYFLQENPAQARKPISGFEPMALQRLLDYDWPGNIRELKACVEYSVIYCQGNRINHRDLPPELQSAASAPVRALAAITEGDERTRFLTALRQTGGNSSRAARLLGISRATFYRRLGQLGLKRDDLDPAAESHESGESEHPPTGSRD